MRYLLRLGVVLLALVALAVGAIADPHAYLPAGHGCALQLSHADTHADAYKHTGALQLPGLQLSVARAAGLHLHVHIGL